MADVSIPPLHFDFGPNANQLHGTEIYAPGTGYGFLAGSSIAARDRGGDPATATFVFSSDMTFVIEALPGAYTLSVRLGDRSAPHDHQGIYAQDVLLDSITTGLDEFVTRDYPVVVGSDGLLRLRCRDLGGNDPNVCLQHLVLTAGGVVPLTAQIAVEPASIYEGDAATLTWRTTGADSVTVDTLWQSANGSCLVRPTASTTYQVVARRGSEVALAACTLTVLPRVQVNEWIDLPHGERIPHFGAHPDIRTVRPGSWSDPATWNQGRTPRSGEVVALDHAVSREPANSGRLAVVCLNPGGSLTLRDGGLSVGTFLQLPESSLFVDPGPGQSVEIFLGGDPLDPVTDPGRHGQGFIGLGYTRIRGRVVVSCVMLAQPARAGEDWLLLATPAEGWSVGDEVVIADQRLLGNDQLPYESGFVSHTERHQIAQVAADLLSVRLVGPLQYDHAERDEFTTAPLAGVANLTRQVFFTSANSTGTPAHMFFSGDAGVDIQSAEFCDLGRTLITPHTAEAPKGRYPVHFHHCRRAPLLQGCSVWQSDPHSNRRGGIVLHATSHGGIQQNVVYNTRGAGIVCEDGAERKNDIVGNVIIGVKGRNAWVDQDNATDPQVDGWWNGAGLWSASADNRIIGNRVWDCTIGYAIVHYGLPQDLVDHHGVTFNPYRQKLLYFAGNHAGGGRMGLALTIWNLGMYGQVVQEGQEESVIADFHIHNVWDKGYFNYKTSRLTFDGLRAAGAGRTCLYAGDYRWEGFRLQNFDIRGFLLGWEMSTFGQEQVIENGHFSCQQNVRIVPRWANATHAELEAEPVRVRLRNVMHTLTIRRPDLPAGHLYFDGAQLIDTTDLQALVQVFVEQHQGVVGQDFRAYFQEQAERSFCGEQAPAGAHACAGITGGIISP